jgi:nucleoside-diphosphate kinase
MAHEITCAIIKPDIVAAKQVGKVISIIEDAGFTIRCMEKGHATKEIAEAFYDVHKDKPFFNELVEFISSDSIIVMAIEKDNAIAEWRKLMGSTNPAEAQEGTIRKLFGTSIGHNAVHGSDAIETAMYELSIFFPFLFENFMNDEDSNENSSEENEQD